MQNMNTTRKRRYKDDAVDLILSEEEGEDDAVSAKEQIQKRQHSRGSSGEAVAS